MLSREQRIDEFIPPMTSAGHGLSSITDVKCWFSSAGGCTSELASCGFDEHGDSSTMVLSRSSGKDDLKVLLHNAAREQFAEFCRHNRKSLCRMHPGFTTEQIDRLLLMQWTELDAAEKSNYSGCYILCYC